MHIVRKLTRQELPAPYLFHNGGQSAQSETTFILPRDDSTAQLNDDPLTVN